MGEPIAIAIHWHLSTGESRDRHLVDGKIRNAWYDTTCCPPNLERTFASLSGYFYSTNADGVYVHLYDNSMMDWHLQDGTGLKVRQQTNYPWSGDVKITVSPAAPREFAMYSHSWLVDQEQRQGEWRGDYGREAGGIHGDSQALGGE